MLHRESRFLAQAKNSGVKVRVYSTEAGETVYFPNTEKSFPSSHTA